MKRRLVERFSEFNPLDYINSAEELRLFIEAWEEESREDLGRQLAAMTAERDCAAELARVSGNASYELAGKLTAAMGLRSALVELKNLFAMVEGECPSLLEDHHSYPKIVAAIKRGNEALAELETKPANGASDNRGRS